MDNGQNIPRLQLFPVTAEVKLGRLVIGGCDTAALAAEFGTPLYLFDEVTLRQMCASFREEFGSRLPTTVIYACKAFINTALAVIMREEGLGLDVVSSGEMGIARAAGFLPEKVYFHGNNKSAVEITAALKWGIGRVVVDNLSELRMLSDIAGGLGLRAGILLRLSPAVDPHTHRYLATGIIDTKFGFPMAGWEEAVEAAMSLPGLEIIGLHFHVGSLIGSPEPYEQAIRVVLAFAARMKDKRGFELRELGVGGGFAVQYTVDTPVQPVAAYAEAIAEAIKAECRAHVLAVPRLVVEPGRAVVGRAGVALYTAGAAKEVPGVRRYVPVDGGMADNIRPALYGARYEALVANKVTEPEVARVTIAGRYCESGDILIRDISLPELAPGDIVAVPVSGAYCLPMASNYNVALKPAVIMVRDGKARLIRRRETPEDIMRLDTGVG